MKLLLLKKIILTVLAVGLMLSLVSCDVRTKPIATSTVPTPIKVISVPDPALPKVISTEVVDLRARPFIIATISFDYDTPSGTKTHTGLSIQGDDRLISFGSSSPPFTPHVSADTITFGGHTFAVGATQGNYRVDGQQVVLPKGGLHVFHNGSFKGTIPE